MDEVTAQNADTQCLGPGDPFLVPQFSTADVYVAHVSGMVAGAPAPPPVRVTQIGVQVLWQENPGGAPHGCNVDTCPSCQPPSPSDPHERGLASRRWWVVVNQGPATGGDAYVCSDYRVTGVIEYDQGCQWSGITDQGAHPISLTKTNFGDWVLSIDYGEDVLSWQVSDDSFNCCDTNTFGCLPLGFPCPPSNHPYPCAVLEPYTGTNYAVAASGGIILAGQSLPAVGYKVFPRGSTYTGAFKARMQGAELGSPATGDVLAVLNGSLSILTWVIDYRGFPGDRTITDAHFHLAPSYGATGSAVRTFTSAERNGSTVPSGRMMGFWRDTDPQPLTGQRILDLQNGLIYADIHTDVNPTGEIRGILVGKMLSGGAQLNEPHVATGGVIFAGSAGAETKSFVAVPKGGIVTSGTPGMVIAWNYNAAGGIKVSGPEELRYTATGGIATAGSATPVIRLASATVGGVTTGGIATVAFHRAPASPTGGAVVAGTYGKLGIAIIPLVRGGTAISGSAVCRAGVKYTAVPATIALGGVAAGTGTALKYTAVVAPVALGGTSKVNNLAFNYVPKYPNNRILVFGNGTYGRNNYEFTATSGSTMGGRAKIAFCKSSCDPSIRYYRDLEGAPGCKVVDPETGKVNYVCARLTYYVANDKRRRVGQGAYLPAATVCTIPKVSRDCYKDQL